MLRRYGRSPRGLRLSGTAATEAVPQYTRAGSFGSTATPGDRPRRCSSTVHMDPRRAISRAARDKESVDISLAEEGRAGEVRHYGVISGDLEAVANVVRALRAPNRRLRFVYEAGPCGFGIHRYLTGQGEDCVVGNPSSMPTRSGDRIKTVHTDKRPLPKYPDPLFNGNSSAWWDGDTLIIESIGFDERTWVSGNGWSHSDQLHVIERIRRPSLNYLEYQFTVEDPKVLTKPWTSGWRKFSLAQSDDRLLENYCTNEQNADHFRKLADQEAERAKQQQQPR